MKKVEQDRYISSHDIDKKLNIDHKIVLNLEKAGYKKKIRWVKVYNTSDCIITIIIYYIV